jgi:SSS family solute:Na+ symporter
VLAGLIGGSLTSVFFFLNAELRPWDIHEGILGLVVNVLLLAGVSLREEPRPRVAPQPRAATVDAADPDLR